MKYHLQYLRYVLKHKWFVFVAGIRIGGIPLWRLIIHDWSKFSKAEWTPYVHRFFSGRAGVEDKSLDPEEFKRAWEHHWQNNAHHWEYWVTNGLATQMPIKFTREMFADWMGAGRAITGEWDITEWYLKTNSKQNLHPYTRGYIQGLVEKYGS